MHSQDKISIVFVNWNSLSYLKACLASLAKYDDGVATEIVVVDNNSPEPGVELLKEEFPYIHIVKSPSNLGFAGANNLGFKNSTGNYLLFLNPDTELICPVLSLLLERLKVLPNAGIIGCRLLNTDRSVQTSCIQTFPTILNQLLDIESLRLRWPACSLWNIAPLYEHSNNAAAVEVISGACMMMKREVFENAGMFSEEYFMYAEDLDLCHKVRSLGLTNYYVGQTLIHHGGKSSGQSTVSQWSTYMKFRAIQRFCVKTRGPLYGLAFRAAMGMAASIRLFALMLMKLFRKRSTDGRYYQSASQKWTAVVRWAFLPSSFLTGNVVDR